MWTELHIYKYLIYRILPVYTFQKNAITIINWMNNLFYPIVIPSSWKNISIDNGVNFR